MRNIVVSRVFDLEDELIRRRWTGHRDKHGRFWTSATPRHACGQLGLSARAIGAGLLLAATKACADRSPGTQRLQFRSEGELVPFRLFGLPLRRSEERR